MSEKLTKSEVEKLLEAWESREKLMRTLHRTDGVLLSIIDSIIKEQIRLSTEQGFWWHIKAAFVSLIQRS